MATAEAQQHPLRVYFWVWGWLFVLSIGSYMVDYLQMEGALKYALITLFMLLKAGLIVDQSEGYRITDELREILAKTLT